jgi:molybdopterin-dependent oxidoreductase alpha subunit
VKVNAPPGSAAGVGGVVRAMSHIISEAGLVRGAKALAVLNQKGGIDCMSCAWPEPDGDRRMAEFCESGAKAVAWEADSRQITASFFERYSVEQLAEQSEHWMGQQGRLAEPMYLREGGTHYEPISWSSAFRLIGRELRALDSPDEAIFYTSGRTSNEAAFLWQLLARRFGTNNLPDCSNMCHESSGVALTETIGIGKGTVTLDDFEKAQVILILGQNPGTNHPRMLTTLKRAKEAGAKIVAINPLIEPGLVRFKDPQEVSGIFGHGTALADLYLQVRINGDTALLKGIMKAMLAAGAIDQEFIAAKTSGWEALAADLESTDSGALIAQSGISEGQIREAAAMIGSADRIIACWAMGLTQQPNSTATIQEIVNLLLMRGSIGKPGAGVCPVRGHSNVQGDRTMGIYEKPSEQFLDRLGYVFQFEPPRVHGFDTVESIKAMHDGRAKVFLAMGGNFLSASPDTEYTAAALRNTRLTVHVSTKLNRSHVVTGKAALILPCLGRTDSDQDQLVAQFVTTENSMGVVESSQGTLRPLSEEMRSEPAIICGIAQAALGLDWEAFAKDYDKIRDLIAQCIPGCEDYNRKVRQPGGFYLPNAPRDGNFTGRFTVHPLPDHSLQANELVMMTIRSHDQFNTTIYGLDDVYRGISGGRRVIFMNADDISAHGLKAGDSVDLHSRDRIARGFTVVPYNIPRGNCATYFPEANPLVPIDSVAAKSNTPSSKYVVITVTPAESPSR